MRIAFLIAGSLLAAGADPEAEPAPRAPDRAARPNAPVAPAPGPAGRTCTVFLVPKKRQGTCRSSSRTTPRRATSRSSVTFTLPRAGVRFGSSGNSDSAGPSAAIEGTPSILQIARENRAV